MNYYGWNPPFFGGHQNVLSKQSGDRIIKNDVIQLIMTEIGERKMRPDWGCGLRRELFGPCTVGNAEAIRSKIYAALEQEPRINVEVTVTPNADDEEMNVKIFGNYTDSPSTEFLLEIGIPLQQTPGVQ